VPVVPAKLGLCPAAARWSATEQAIRPPGGRNRNHPYGSRDAQGKSVFFNTGGLRRAGMGRFRLGTEWRFNFWIADDTAGMHNASGFLPL
jgi:hypothetical protein